MTIWNSGLQRGRVFPVPTITLEGDANGAPHPEANAYAKKFSGKVPTVISGGVGHISRRRLRAPSPKPSSNV